MDNNLKTMQHEIERRRAFAIISHPDAGKTTLTEKLLLYGGAIHLAGSVKSRKSSRHATSDWMEIEKQRGISVTSSVMEFDYRNHKINILDTPGHQDFSEDTYRTLTAADSAVMIIDVAKGVEAQTKKLFEVCSLRGIPIFTFINKMDREGKDPFELLEELENVLGIRSYPMNWPIGMGQDFKGVYDRHKNRVELYNASGNETIDYMEVEGIEDPRLKDLLSTKQYEQLADELPLLDIAGDPYDLDLILNGKLTPVFFGSAVTNFGVQAFLDNFLNIAPSPTPKNSDKGLVEPVQEKFSGFVFKIQANMNPAHRDRIAFLRVCSGKFERGMPVTHVRTNKTIKLAQPQQFFAQERNIIEEAYAGDIIGLFDPGIFQIGDTLCQGETFEFTEMPYFSPEIFSRVTVKDSLKSKSFQKGIHQLTEEGAIQVFHSFGTGIDQTILGVVGVLQFEVLQYRMKAEYGVEVMLQRMPYQLVRWVRGEKFDPRQFQSTSYLCVKDRYDDTAILFENEFSLRWVVDKYPDLKFVDNTRV